MPPLVRDLLEVLMVVALGGMLWAAVAKVRGGRVAIPRCASCGRPGSRAYEHCPGCGAPYRPTR